MAIDDSVFKTPAAIVVLRGFRHDVSVILNGQANKFQDSFKSMGVCLMPKYFVLYSLTNLFS